MDNYERQKYRDQAAAFALRAAIVILAGAGSYYASSSAGVTSREWAAGLSMIAVHLAIEHVMKRR